VAGSCSLGLQHITCARSRCQPSRHRLGLSPSCEEGALVEAAAPAAQLGRLPSLISKDISETCTSVALRAGRTCGFTRELPRKVRAAPADAFSGRTLEILSWCAARRSASHEGTALLPPGSGPCKLAVVRPLDASSF